MPHFRQVIAVAAGVAVVGIAAGCSSSSPSAPAAGSRPGQSASGAAGSPGSPGSSVTGVACPTLWADSPLLLPCGKVPAGMLPDVTAVAGPFVAGRSGCAQTRPASEGEAFVTVTSGDPTGQNAMNYVLNSQLPTGPAGVPPDQGPALVSAAFWCDSPAAAQAYYTQAVKSGSDGTTSGESALPAVGAENRWFTQSSSGFTSIQGWWRQGTTVGWLALAGPDGQVSMTEAAGLADAQNQAIIGSAQPPRYGTASFATRPTACPAIWQSEPLVPCSQIPAGLVPDPTGGPVFFAQGNSAPAFQVTTCRDDYAFYDNVTPATGGIATSMVADVAGYCGSSADSVYQADGAIGGSTGHAVIPGLGSRSLAECHAQARGIPDCAVIWVDGGWVGEILDTVPHATLATVEAMARAQDAKLRAGAASQG